MRAEEAEEAQRRADEEAKAKGEAQRIEEETVEAAGLGEPLVAGDDLSSVEKKASEELGTEAVEVQKSSEEAGYYYAYEYYDEEDEEGAQGPKEHEE